jgi:uncharacterized protein DUF6082
MRIMVEGAEQGVKMAAGEPQGPKGPARRPFMIIILALSIILLGGTMVGVVISPVLLNAFYADGRDYSVSADVGQAFGGASALIGCMTLFAVLGSVIIQHHQLKEIQRDKHAESTDALVLMAVDNPRFRQCWGARVAPDGIEEDLFYYCSHVLKGWARAWELRKIDERQAREYLRCFFDSEVPRLFFEKYGDWHRRGQTRNHRERFQEFANEEYLRAIKSGPPLRRYERYPARESTLEAQLTRLETVDEVLPLRPVEGENRSR